MDAACKEVYGSGPLWVTDKKDKLPIFIPKGATGSAALPPMTLPELFHETVARNAEGTAMSWRVVDGTSSAGTPSFYSYMATKVTNSHWDSMTWKGLEDECYTFGAACLAAGLQPKQTVVVMGFNSPHWLLATHGVAMAGGVLAGSYPTNNKETCEYLAKDSDAKILLAETWAHGEKFVDVLTAKDETLSKVVIWGDTSKVPEEHLKSGAVVPFAVFMAEGKGMKDGVAKVKAAEAALTAGECVELIYTSGTTGMPKGVMLSHDNLTWDCRAGIIAVEEESGVKMGAEQVFLSYLPLSHIAAQVLDFMMAVASGGHIFFATPDALAGAIVPLLQEARPTFFFGVPRVWEKVMDSVKAKAADNSNFKKFISTHAKATGLAHNTALAESGGASSGDMSILFTIFNAVVYSKLKAMLGLDRAFLLGSGAAPISKEVLSFFWSLDLPVVEGFGMSETTGIMSVSNFPSNVKLGTVGTSIVPNGIKLDKTKGTKDGEGEICMRGRNIMMGYLNKPDKTAVVFDESRFLRSEDLGSLTKSPGPKGKELLSITGRIKELIITAGGENIPPILIEDAIKANTPIVSNAVLIGDRRKYLTLLVTLRVDIDPTTLMPSDKLNPNGLLACKAIESTATTCTEAKQDPKVKAAIQAGIDKYNKTQAASRAQNIQKFVILDKDFSVPGGELTGSQKLKRAVVYDKFGAEIESMYEGA